MNNRRFMLSVPDDIAEETAKIKKEMFFDKPYSEMYRYILRKGIDALKLEEPTL